MEEAKKCSKCQGEMEKGRIGSVGQLDTRWHSNSSLLGKITGSGKKLIAWKCTKCNTVEFQVEE